MQYFITLFVIHLVYATRVSTVNPMQASDINATNGPQAQNEPQGLTKICC